ncbi:MAG: GAF domain-containing protein [Anaerolineales bacterium]|nr:GAF domain-containing protein [Anaerolineales bacterium]
MKAILDFPNKVFRQIINSPDQRKYFAPVTLFVVLLFTMFIVEVSIMGVLFVIPEMPGIYAVFLDGFLLTVISVPVLFYLYLRPMMMQIQLQQESERRFRAVFEQTFQFMCVINPEGVILQANQSAILAVGTSRTEMIGKSFWEVFTGLITEEAGLQLQKAFEAAFRGNLTRFEQDFRARGNRNVTVDVSIKPIMNEQGQVTMVILEGRDVTPHKQIEQALRTEIDNRREKERRIQENARRAIVLSEILDSLQEVNEDYQVFLTTAVQKTAELLGDACLIHLLSENERQLRPVAFHHDRPEAHDALARIMMHAPRTAHEGLAWQVIQSKTPLFLPTVDFAGIYEQILTEHRSYFEQHGLKSLILFPLQIQGQILGILFLFRDQTSLPYTQEDVDFVQNIALKAAMAVHNVRLYQAEKRSRQTAETLGAAALALTQTLKLDFILDKLLDYLELLGPFETACICLLENENRLTARTIRGPNIWTHSEQNTSLNLSNGSNLLVEMPLLTQRSLFIPNIPQSLGWDSAPVAMTSGLSIPIVASENVLGLCILGKEVENGFTQEHIQWAEAMVNQAAVAIQNAWLFEQVRTGNERLQSLSNRLVEIQENERRYIARELHDEAGQALTSLMVGLRILERDAYQPEAVLTGAAELKRLVNEVLENLHRLAVRLRPASLDHLGLIPALQQYIEDFSTRHGVLVQFETMGVDTRLRGDLETVLYRIVQEALTNVIKHARATRVDVLLERRGNKLITIVEDNGVGFETAEPMSGNHLGLFGIRERLEMFNGQLHLESTPNVGTTLFIEVPYET